MAPIDARSVGHTPSFIDSKGKEYRGPMDSSVSKSARGIRNMAKFVSAGCAKDTKATPAMTAAQDDMDNWGSAYQGRRSTSVVVLE